MLSRSLFALMITSTVLKIMIVPATPNQTHFQSEDNFTPSNNGKIQGNTTASNPANKAVGPEIMRYTVARSIIERIVSRFCAARSFSVIEISNEIRHPKPAHSLDKAHLITHCPAVTNPHKLIHRRRVALWLRSALR